MTKILLTTLCVVSTSLHLLGAEPSAFGAGNLNSSTPYGLTSSEKTVLQNKNALKSVVAKSNNQAFEVESLRERIDGLQSIVESLSRKSQKNKTLLSKFEIKSLEDVKNTDEYEKRLGEVVELNAKLISENTLSIEKNLLVLKELSKLINAINTSYVSKEEFNTLVNDMNEFKSLVAKELKAKTEKKVSTLSMMENGTVADKAKEFYAKQYYTKSIEYYTHLISKNYKPAHSHFMVGQMKFKRKNYSEAISYYKKSASLYAKASYMPELLLNTAISMHKTNDVKNAKVFFGAIISKYPESIEASSARENLLVL